MMCSAHATPVNEKFPMVVGNPVVADSENWVAIAPKVVVERNSVPAASNVNPFPPPTRPVSPTGEDGIFSAR